MSKFTEYRDLWGIYPNGIDDTDYAGDATNTTNKFPVVMPGALRAIEHRRWGFQTFRWVQNKSNGTLTKGVPMAFVAPVSAGTVTAGTVNSITTSGLTANEYQYDHIICTLDNPSGGAAPEGEDSYIVSHSATLITLDPDLPFTAAVAASDTFNIYTRCHVIAIASGDEQAEFAGVIQAASLLDNYWGWVQVTGLCPYVALPATTAIANLSAMIAGTATLTISSSSAVNLLCAIFMGGRLNTTDRLFGMAELKGNLNGFGALQMVTE